MKSSSFQPQLPLSVFKLGQPQDGRAHESIGGSNKVEPKDKAFHDWYRFVLSFPPHLVSDYIKDFRLDTGHVILDPFCGTGTTLVESKLRGFRGIGIEANGFAHFASSVKVDWEVDPEILRKRSREIADSTRKVLKGQDIDDDVLFSTLPRACSFLTLHPEAEKLLLTNSISPLPLHKTLVLLDHLREHRNEHYYSHALLALANALVFRIHERHFGPEVGVGKPKEDVPVVRSWLFEVEKICRDLTRMRGRSFPSSQVLRGDAREVSRILPPLSVDAVITSPPYPNEKDYTRTTRLESVILGFIRNKSELREMKKTFVRSNTRSVYKDDDDDRWITGHAEIQRIAEAIEKRREELGKNSGFERMYEG